MATFMCSRSQQTNLFWLVRPVLRAGESLPSRSKAEAVAGFHYGATAIEVGVFPTPYVKRGFKFPLLTPNA